MGYRIQYEYANLIIKKFRKTSILFNAAVLSVVLIAASFCVHILCGAMYMVITGQGSAVKIVSDMIIEDVQSGETLLEAFNHVREMVYGT